MAVPGLMRASAQQATHQKMEVASPALDSAAPIGVHPPHALRPAAAHTCCKQPAVSSRSPY